MQKEEIDFKELMREIEKLIYCPESEETNIDGKEGKPIKYTREILLLLIQNHVLKEQHENQEQFQYPMKSDIAKDLFGDGSDSSKKKIDRSLKYLKENQYIFEEEIKIDKYKNLHIKPLAFYINQERFKNLIKLSREVNTINNNFVTYLKRIQGRS